MSNFDPDTPSENDWEERGDLAWNEFDWEQYLREQDDVLHRYLAFYEQLREHPERIDEVAQRCEALKDDPYLLGYFVGNEPPWPTRAGHNSPG